MVTVFHHGIPGPPWILCVLAGARGMLGILAIATDVRD
jgi:hypothetical protein